MPRNNPPARLALALIVSLLFTLCAGCAPSGERLDVLQADVLALQESLEQYLESVYTPADVESAEDFEWNGETTAWFVLPSNVTPEQLLAANAVSAMCQANGWTYSRKELGSGAGTAATLLKAAIASGDVGAVIYTGLADYMSYFLQQAANQGIIVLCLDPEAPSPIAGSVAEPRAQMARETAALLETWCKEQGYAPQEGNLLPVAVSLHGASGAKEEWPAALLDALGESDLFFKSRIGLGYDETDTIFNAAFLWARNVMADVPETRLFCCYTPEAAYGICYYLEQYAADNKLDLADFCVVWNGEDADSRTYLTVAREDDSYTAARGYVTAGSDAWTTGALLGYELLGIAHGTELPASLKETYASPAENGVTVPESFGGWLWGENALSDITVYASFAEKDDLVLTGCTTPMTDIVDLTIPTEETEEAE